MANVVNYILDPLLIRLSIRKLLLFTACNKHIYGTSYDIIKYKCREKYQIDESVILHSWRYTLALLSFGYREIPIIVNLSKHNDVKLQFMNYFTIYADDIYNEKGISDNNTQIDWSISINDHYIYYTHKYQIKLTELTHTLDDYYNSPGKIEELINFYGTIMKFPGYVSKPRKSCQRINDFSIFRDNKYIGLCKRDSDTTTLFNSITSIDIFMM